MVLRIVYPDSEAHDDEDVDTGRAAIDISTEDDCLEEEDVRGRCSSVDL
jgi:hypothetical protein